MLYKKSFIIHITTILDLNVSFALGSYTCDGRLQTVLVSSVILGYNGGLPLLVVSN